MTLILFTFVMLNAAIWLTGAHAGHGGGTHSDRYLVAAKINRVLAATPMRGAGFIFERFGYKHHISPYFMVAVSATESSLGRAACRNNPKNVWGLASCNNSWPVPYFETWSEAVGFYARFLVRTWPRARTAHEFYGYAACSSCWGRTTAYWMQRLFGVGPSVAYP